MVRGDGGDVHQDSTDIDCVREGARDGQVRCGLVNYLALRDRQYVYVSDICFCCRIPQSLGSGGKGCSVSDLVPPCKSWFVCDVRPVGQKKHLCLPRF